MVFQDVPQDPSLADPLPGEPCEILGRWLGEAREQQVQRNPMAMSVATVSPEGRPSLRVVLCRGYEPEPGYVVFYTDRESRKGVELAAAACAAASFHWDGIQRQARLEGPVLLSPDAESDAYFASRPRPSQVAAWASNQSRPMASRRELLDKLRDTEERFGGPEGPPIPRPPNWGGYRIWLERVELWVGADGRAHDRALWQRTLEPAADGFRGGSWTLTRLQP